jgi:transposase
MKIQESFIDLFKHIIENKYNEHYPSRKVAEITYFEEIINVITSNTYWSRYKGKINWKVLHNKHIEYIKKGFYDELFRIITKKYIESNKYYIYKIQSTDTSFISNKCCSGLPRNKFYKSKRGVKISSINDINGIPLSLIVTEGSVNDAKILIDTFNNMHVDTHTNNYKHSNRHRQNFLADKGYDTVENRTLIENKGYKVIIAYNKRNTKEPTKLKKLTAKEKVIYKQRIVVENYYSWIKMFPKLMFVFEKSINNYQQILFLATCLLIFNRFLS